MSISPMQRALDTNKIVETIPLFKAHIRHYKEMLSMQRTCSTWYAVMRRSLRIRQPIWLSVPALRTDDSINNDYAVALEIGLEKLTWVCNSESQKIPASGVCSAAKGSQNLSCEEHKVPPVWTCRRGQCAPSR